jgi:hypothetical protein
VRDRTVTWAAFCGQQELSSPQHFDRRSAEIRDQQVPIRVVSATRLHFLPLCTYCPHCSCLSILETVINWRACGHSLLILLHVTSSPLSLLARVSTLTSSHPSSLASITFSYSLAPSITLHLLPLNLPLRNRYSCLAHQPNPPRQWPPLCSRRRPSTSCLSEMTAHPT